MTNTATTTRLPVSTTVYVTAECTRCPRLIKQLTRFGIAPQVIDVGETPAARELLVDHLGLQEVPLTVVTGLFEHPVAFTGHALDQLIAIRRLLSDVDESIDSSIGLSPTGLPTGVEIDHLHWLNVSGDLVPVAE